MTVLRFPPRVSRTGHENDTSLRPENCLLSICLQPCATVSLRKKMIELLILAPNGTVSREFVRNYLVTVHEIGGQEDRRVISEWGCR